MSTKHDKVDALSGAGALRKFANYSIKKRVTRSLGVGVSKLRQFNDFELNSRTGARTRHFPRWKKFPSRRHNQRNFHKENSKIFLNTFVRQIRAALIFEKLSGECIFCYFFYLFEIVPVIVNFVFA